MANCLIHTTNPTTVEVGVQFHLPTDDLHWIANGFETVNFTLDAQDLEDDFYSFVGEAAQEWCDANGYSFFQLIEEP